MSNAEKVIIADEDLPKLARFSFDHADALCDVAHGCKPYHKTWSYLRLFERGGALPVGEAFYREELKQVVARAGTRVLLSGAADTGLMALVVKVFAELGVAPDITLVDRCGTVIEQNRLFTETLNLKAEFFVGDICDFCADPFDVIFAHSFLLFFPDTAKIGVLARTWRRLLKDDGIVLSSDYMSTSLDAVKRSRISEDELEGRLAAVRKAAEDHGMDKASIHELWNCGRAAFMNSPSTSAPILRAADMGDGMRDGGLQILRTSVGAYQHTFNSLRHEHLMHFLTVLGALDQPRR
jgi:SAM-dependent methyltransferase